MERGKHMASSSKEIAVFTDTNLGTHIAVAVSPDITAENFKRELERRHFSCFPKIGEIKVYGLLVKRMSSFYHLPNSLPIKYAFQGFKGTWFLRVEANTLFDSDGPSLNKCMNAKIIDHNPNTSTEKNHVISNGKEGRVKGSYGSTAISKRLSRSESISKRKRKKEKRVESVIACDSSPLEEIPSEGLIKAVVAADCIEKCSSNYSDVSRLGCPSSADVTSMTIQNHLQKQLIARRDHNLRSIYIDALPQFTVKTPPRMSSFSLLTNPKPETSRNNRCGTEVGKRLVKASKNISVSTCKSSPIVSFCRLKNKKMLYNSASSCMAKYLAFEISDNDDD